MVQENKNYLITENGVQDLIRNKGRAHFGSGIRKRDIRQVKLI